MRLAIVATPALLPDQRPAPGAIDGDVMRARLPLEDTGFQVVDLDPAVDLAEQLDGLFDTIASGADDAVLFYVSSALVVSVDGEPFFCLDPMDVQTGDAIADLAAVFKDRARGPVLFLLDVRHLPDPADPFRSAVVVAAAREAVNPAENGIELLVAARPDDAMAAERPSPFTRALVAALDDVGTGGGEVTARSLYERIRESEALVGVVPCFSHARGRVEFVMAPGGTPTVPMVMPIRIEERGNENEHEHEHDGIVPLSVPEPIERVVAFQAIVDEPSGEDVPLDEPSVDIPVDEASGQELQLEEEVVVSSKRSSLPPTALPQERTFLKTPEELPRVIVSDRPPPPEPELPWEERLAHADGMKDADAALQSLKVVLGMLDGAQVDDRAGVYRRIGKIKAGQGKRREAISNFEKALHLSPRDRGLLELVLEMDIAERDWRGVAATEERVLALVDDRAELVERLVISAKRWEELAGDRERARKAFDKARSLAPDDTRVLEGLCRAYAAMGAVEELLATRRRLAELTEDPREKATHYYELAKRYFYDLGREAEGLQLFDEALEADPSMLEPLEIVATVLAERMEYGELESAYRKMLERIQRVPRGNIRQDVTAELCRKLGFLYRDHLEDPVMALMAFEDALGEKPDDLSMRLAAVDLAKSLGKLDRAAAHLEAAAFLEPARPATYHEIFDVSQRLRKPDRAYSAAHVTMFMRSAEARERFVFEEHRPAGVPKFARPIRNEAWDLLRVAGRDLNVEGIFVAVADAAIATRLELLRRSKRLPSLDGAIRQDPEKSTASIVRSFVWASHFLGVAAPAIYVREDAELKVAAVPTEEPSVIAGGSVLRGRSLPELAFLVGRHLAYHVPPHRVLLYYPSLEDLSACFVAAVKIALPGIPIPKPLLESVSILRPLLEAKLGKTARAALEAAAHEFEAAGTRADLAAWVGAVERCATRTGILLAGDLAVATAVLKADPRGVVAPEDKVRDLCAFVASDAHSTLRAELGIAIQP